MSAADRTPRLPDCPSNDADVLPSDAPNEPWLREPPLLIAELLSPSTRDVDLGRKRELYAMAGLQWYWVVDTNAQTLTVFHHDGASLAPTQVIDHAEVAEGPLAVSFDPALLFPR